MKLNSRLRQHMKLKAWDMFADGHSVRQVSQVLQISIGKAHSIKKQLDIDATKDIQTISIQTELMASITIHKAIMAEAMSIVRKEGQPDRTRLEASRLVLDCRRYLDQLIDTMVQAQTTAGNCNVGTNVGKVRGPTDKTFGEKTVISDSNSALRARRGGSIV